MIPRPATPPPCPRLDAPDRAALRDYFLSAQAHYEWVFSGFTDRDAAFAARPHPFRNTIGFYYGHTAAFYVQKLKLVGLLEGGVNARLDAPLERGVSPDRPVEEADGRAPDALALESYRRRVHDAVLSVIEDMPLSGPIKQGDPAWAILMGVEHEFIHLHTSLPLIRQLDLSLVREPAGWRRSPTYGDGVENANWVRVPGGPVAVGRTDADAPRYYGWDNEFGPKEVALSDFELRDRPVTNAEYYDFVRAGAYERSDVWTTAEARVWFETMKPMRPAAWRGDVESGFRYRSVFAEFDMPWDWPVEVCRHEAQAFANWAGAHLLSEAEFMRAVETGRVEQTGLNVGFGFCSPTPSAPKDGRADLIGGVARWTRDDFAPTDEAAFAPHHAYADFSEPWFGPDHGVLVGASFASLGHMAQPRLMRDFMQNHMDQLAGITLVRKAA